MYLMYRISNESNISKKLLKKVGLLSIGWYSIVESGYYDEVIEKINYLNKYEFSKYFMELGQKLNYDSMTRNRSYFLYNFLRLRPSDYVVVAESGVFNIYKVVGTPYSNSKSTDNIRRYDIGFLVKVERVFEDVPRSEYLTSRLNSALKFRGTNLVLDDWESDIKIVMKNIEKKEPVFSMRPIKNNIAKRVHEHILKKLDENQFEILIKEYLRKIGSSEPKIPSKQKKNSRNDSIADIDVIAPFNKIGAIIYVQAKHHDGVSDRYGIEQLIGYVL
ncbi:Restriction endonuclease [Anaerosphaera aminiphila DSM 21120]|uniref:Restriction endonuclease n=1 Tax=Anaerosphaera aminiphila DSM 21120 TaxID=1120995 RepID=A0A1M5PLG7_9FIRM|nr:restriction endonuclease [Anaerosphaera aminiphila]SHH02591.1 Restriction endonuclease [Anaerosphaera aminiphila DSM 21120]